MLKSPKPPIELSVPEKLEWDKWDGAQRDQKTKRGSLK
jgi:hypothetical protein